MIDAGSGERGLRDLGLILTGVPSFLSPMPPPRTHTTTHTVCRA